MKTYISLNQLWAFLRCILHTSVKLFLYVHNIGMHDEQNIFNLELVLCHVQCKVLTKQLSITGLRTLFVWHMRLASLGNQYPMF